MNYYLTTKKISMENSFDDSAAITKKEIIGNKTLDEEGNVKGYIFGQTGKSLKNSFISFFMASKSRLLNSLA